MSKLERTLNNCGLIGPLENLLKKNEDVNNWSITLIAMKELAKKTMTEMEYKSAIRTKYKKYKAEEALVCNAQTLSSPDSSDDPSSPNSPTSGKNEPGNYSIGLYLMIFALIQSCIHNRTINFIWI